MSTRAVDYDDERASESWEQQMAKVAVCTMLGVVRYSLLLLDPVAAVRTSFPLLDTRSFIFCWCDTTQ